MKNVKSKRLFIFPREKKRNRRKPLRLNLANDVSRSRWKPNRTTR